MQPKHIQLRERRDIGEIISVYFEFLKTNLIGFLNIFIRYNGIFLLGFLGVSYLLVTGFVGTFQASGNSAINEKMITSQMYMGFGVISFFILFIITAVLNYSLAASYIINYEKSETITVDKTQVWKLVSDNLGKILLFILVLILLYVALSIVGVILALIPIIGTLAYYLLMMAFTSWVGVSFMAMLYKNLDITNAFGEGWRLVTTYFWKSVLVNLVISLLLVLIMAVVLMVPGILIGIYTFHSIDSGVDLATSPFAKIIWIIALTILLFLYTFNQSLSQFINGILYFSLHEETYNEKTRERIEQIGTSE